MCFISQISLEHLARLRKYANDGVIDWFTPQVRRRGVGGGGARPTLTGTYIQVLSARATTASGVSFDAMNVKTMLMVRFFFFSSADCSLTHALTLVGLCFCFFGQGLLANVASIHEPVPRAATRR